MNARGTAGPDAPGCYEIRIQGRLDEHWSAWLDDMDVSSDHDGITLVRGPVVDQAALHGLLATLRDIGLPLISVTRVDPAPVQNTSDPDQRSGD